MLRRHNEEFTVLGVSESVRNDDPAVIGALWAAFRGRDLRAEIGAGMSDEVYCVYHDYDGGFLDPFRMTIGYRVSSNVEPPATLHRVTIPAQEIAAYQVNGPQPQTLIAQWQAIWEGGLERAYLADFDVYDASDPGVVTVCVGLAKP